MASSLDVQSAPNTSAPLAGSRTLYAGDTFTAVNEVTGGAVNGNNLWWVSSFGNYVWSGGTQSTNKTTSAGGAGSASGQYKDGTYTGTVADAIYGQLEVVATIQGGKLTDTNCPIYPNSPGHTSQVSQQALPQLKQEAIAAQSANINIVSGATQTSEAYQQSLAAALAQAK